MSFRGYTSIVQNLDKGLDAGVNPRCDGIGPRTLVYVGKQQVNAGTALVEYWVNQLSSN